MPKYIQPVKVHGKRRYAVFSTITMSFHSKLYPNLRAIRKQYPKLPCKRKALQGTGYGSRRGGLVKVAMPVYTIKAKDWKKFAVKG